MQASAAMGSKVVRGYHHSPGVNVPPPGAKLNPTPGPQVLLRAGAGRDLRSHRALPPAPCRDISRGLGQGLQPQ